MLILLGSVLLVVQWYMYNKPKAAERPTPYYTIFTRPFASNLWTKKVQLCIMFNLNNIAPDEEAINLLLTYYSPLFNHIMLLFDGNRTKPNYLPKNVAFSSCFSGRGWFEHKCLRICLNETWHDSRPEGYLFIADDMFINLAMMSSLPLSQLWYLQPGNINYTARASLRNTWHWNWALKPLEDVIEHLPAEWKDIIVKVGFPDRLPIAAVADIVYVPYSLAGTMTDVLTFITRTAQLISEVALPLAVDIVAPTDRVNLIDGLMWGAERGNNRSIENRARKCHFVHPIKLSAAPQARLWETLMEEQLKNLSAVDEMNLPSWWQIP